MKKFKSYYFFSFLAITFFSLYIVGCTGDDGPAGQAGMDGEDGTANCLTCHNETMDLKTKILQWTESGHGSGDSYARGSSSSCAECHAHEGFMQLIAGEEVTGAAFPTPVGCRTCHPIHQAFTMDDYAINTVEAVTLSGEYSVGVEVNIGTGNLCVNCHQSRLREYGIEIDGTGDLTIASHFGPHHGPQTNVYVGAGLFEIPGSVAYTNSVHASTIDNGCVTCHTNEGNHTFEASEDACAVCHTDFDDDFDYRGVQTDYHTIYDTLTSLLLAEGLIEWVEEDEMYEAISGEVTTHNKAGALFNWVALGAEDGSFGIHNTAYSMAALQNSIEVFN